MPINGQKIDSAISPDKMKKSDRDRSSMYIAEVNLASLPGVWHQAKGVLEELFTETQKMAQLTSTILQAVDNFKRMEVKDTTWSSTIQHSLGNIKSQDNVFASMKKLRKRKKSAFQQQDNLTEHFLYGRHYSSKYI
jgi:Skp family chaperone for outer membrane proteins